MRVGGVQLAATPQRFMIDTRRRGGKSVRWRRTRGGKGT